MNVTQQAMVPSQDSFEPEPHAGTGPFQVVWRRKALLLLGLVTGVVVGLLYYVQAAPVYESKAQVLVVKKYPEVVTSVDVRQFSVEDYMSTHQTLLKSALIIQKAIDKHNLASLKSFAGKPDDLMETVIKTLTVSRIRGQSGNNNVLDVACRTKDPGESAQVLEAVIESYRDFVDENYKDQSEVKVKQSRQGAG